MYNILYKGGGTRPRDKAEIYRLIMKRVEEHLNNK